MKKIFTKCILINIVFMIFIIPGNTKVYAQETKLIKRSMTQSEFQKFKTLTGTYEKGKNYNQIINGHGTGLMPPTEEQWERMKNQPILADKIEVISGLAAAPANYDNSTTIWFPPIGNQGIQNSCVSWACGYYTKTFQEAEEHNWDISKCLWVGHPDAAYQDKIFSPAFIYNQVNNGGNNATYYSDNINLLGRIGCCTWDKMPYIANDYTTWPTESAWRQAPLYRSQPNYSYMNISTDQGIENLKQFLANGNLAIVAVSASYFANLNSSDLWTLDNYNPSGTNHANTIVGYNDNYGPYTESGNSNTFGAFKVANSWGVGGWEHIPDGFYYISYECMKQRIQYTYLYQNYMDYKPEMVAVFEIDHSKRGENDIDFGIGDPATPYSLKTFNNFIAKGGDVSFPNNRIAIDITEFMPYLGSTNQFFMSVSDGGTSTTGTIESFSIEKYDDYARGVPTNVYTSTEIPINTQQNNTVYANIYGSTQFLEQTSINLPGVYFGWWGDYDNDGDLDLLLLTNPGAKIYRNKGDNTFELAISLTDIGYSSAAWGDYDNDGDLDILMTGGGYASKIYSNNGNDIFEEQTISLPAVSNGSTAWGDYNNDGKPDILLTGESANGLISKIYRSNGNNTFEEETSASLTGVDGSSAAWGDYDKDGDLDILLAGESANGPITKIYRNNGDNTFTDIVSLTGVSDCSAAWGDYDNDGYPDILISGNSSSGPISKIYRNNGNGAFEEQAISLTNVSGSFAAWGDYDNDGNLDIILTGNTGSEYVTKLYHNDGYNPNNGHYSFTEQTSVNLTGVSGQICWGDYDNDGDLDLFLAGYTGNNAVSKVYSNNNETPNTLPSVPSNLQAAVNGNNVTFSWVKSTDNETQQNGLTYNLIVGTTPGARNIVLPMSDINTGKRRIVSIGNAGHNNSWTIKGLPDGQYFWSVQAIDNNFAGSNFASTKSFTVGNVFAQFTEQTGISIPGVSSSSAAWGDYDNDGDLDILLTGSNNDGIYISKIYRNDGDNKYTEQTDNFLTGFRRGYWGDYDNDGYLDILLTGGSESKIYRNNGDNTFTEQTSISLPGSSAAVWGDYDNDGYLDILLGNKIYHNNRDNSFTQQTQFSPSDLYVSSACWGDYDNDGDLDILLIGQYMQSYHIIQVTKIYRNNGDNTFTDLSSIIHLINGFSDGAVAWGDYDNDGDLDILITGGGHFMIYRNDGNNVFTEISIPLLIGNCSAAWGDYDNDGDLDILITGLINEVTSKIYRNDGADTFTEQTSIYLSGVSGQAAWGDYDNDGDLDILLTGRDSDGNSISKIYCNNNKITNTLPSIPSNLQAVVNGNAVTFSWDKSTDNETPRNGLTYSLVIGTSPNAVNMLSPMSDRTSGYRRVINLGNTNHNNSWTIKGLPEGKYYWSVQSIDNCFAGSLFSETQTFEIGTGISACIKVFLQGPYNSGTMSTAINSSGYLPGNQPYNVFPWNYNGKESVASDPNFFKDNSSIVDWVVLELRTATKEGDPSTATNFISSRAAFLRNDGTIVDLDGTSPVDFIGISSASYYIVIKHRNHLAIMSHDPVSLPNSTVYTFTNGNTFGANAMVDFLDGNYGMWAGDVNGDGFVKYNGAGNDIVPMLTRLNYILSQTKDGYYNEDVNLNGQVKYNGAGNDVVIILQNLNYILSTTKSTQVPN